MSLAYTGHCALAPDEAEEALGHFRRGNPQWFASAFRLEPAMAPPEPFGMAISRDFGIAARAWFHLRLIDKQAGSAREVIAALYRGFPRGALVITWELDEIIPPPGG